jgi:hypothetical protein
MSASARASHWPAHVARLSSLVVLLAAACAADPPPPPPRVTTARAAPAAASGEPLPSRPINAFDGRYAGTMTLNPDRTRRCRVPEGSAFEMVVRGGRGSFLVNPTTRQVLSGTVEREGSLRLVDAVDRTIATSGVFTADGFIGDHRDGLCTYAVNLRRIG